MANPIVAIIFGVIGGLIGASIYEGFRFDTYRMWDGHMYGSSLPKETSLTNTDV
jgi:glycopeptide antibiotics resistance protein